jgi:hypothetical protein
MGLILFLLPHLVLVEAGLRASIDVPPFGCRKLQAFMRLPAGDENNQGE